MKHPISWQCDEFKQIGKNYGQPAGVVVHDSSHADFRDIERESDAVLDRLGVKAGEVLIDFGAGTGTFAIQAVRRGLKVFAVDVSAAM